VIFSPIPSPARVGQPPSHPPPSPRLAASPHQPPPPPHPPPAHVLRNAGIDPAHPPQPPQPQQQPWGEVPHISTLLSCEAAAWHALLSIHGLTIGSARALNTELNEMEDVAAQREGNYCASLSSLASQCDSLSNETIKIRSLRKARRQIELSPDIATILHKHSNEALAVGERIARDAGNVLAGAIADLRSTTQALKSQVSQCRALLEAVRAAEMLKLDPATRIVIGLQTGDDECKLLPIGDVIRAAYHEGHVTDESLVAALAGEAAPSTPPETHAVRTFHRRAAR
jgi:hypothetical protein